MTIIQADYQLLQIAGRIRGSGADLAKRIAHGDEGEWPQTLASV